MYDRCCTLDVPSHRTKYEREADTRSLDRGGLSRTIWPTENRAELVFFTGNSGVEAQSQVPVNVTARLVMSQVIFTVSPFEKYPYRLFRFPKGPLRMRE